MVKFYDKDGNMQNTETNNKVLIYQEVKEKYAQGLAMTVEEYEFMNLVENEIKLKEIKQTKPIFIAKESEKNLKRFQIQEELVNLTKEMRIQERAVSNLQQQLLNTKMTIYKIIEELAEI